MAKNTPTPTNPSRLRFARILLLVLASSLIGIIIYRNYQEDLEGYSSIPKEVRLKYLPSEFDYQIDQEQALRVLSDPRRYEREFDELVYNMNVAILQHVAQRMSLDRSVQRKVEKEYRKHHEYLKNLYYQDFMSIKDTTANLYETWYENQNTGATDILREVASKYTCFLTTHVIASLVETKEGSLYGQGENVDTPCGIALTEALNPMMNRLKERASIRDFNEARGLMQEKVERVIAELATMEVRDKKGISKRMQTKLFGFQVSSTEVDISAISILKVGFRLNQYFDIELDEKSGFVIVTLPEPVILSHEVHPRFDKLNIGWMREVEDGDMNRAINALRAEFRREANESDIREDAKMRAAELIETMFGPVVQSMNRRYEVRVRFQAVDPDYPDSEVAASQD